MIVHAYYEEDPRVRREAESLVGERTPGRRPRAAAPGRLPPRSVLDGVHVRRLDVQRHQGAGLGTYLARVPLVPAPRRRGQRSGCIAASGSRSSRSTRCPTSSCSPPLPLRLVGVPGAARPARGDARVLPVSRFPRASNPLSHRLLLLQERLSIAFATRRAHRQRGDAATGCWGSGVAPDKVVVVINSPSLERFDAAAHPRRPFREDGALRLVYTGAPDPDLRAGRRRSARWPTSPTERPDLDVRFDLYGRGDSEDALRALAAELGIAERVDVPRAHPDRGRAGGGRRRGHRAGPDPARPVHRDDPLDQGLRVRGDGQAGRRVAAADGRAHLPCGHRRRPTSRAMPTGWPRRSSPSPTIRSDAEAAIARTRDVVRDAAWEREAERYVAIVDRLART